MQHPRLIDAPDKSRDTIKVLPDPVRSLKKCYNREHRLKNPARHKSTTMSSHFAKPSSNSTTNRSMLKSKIHRATITHADLNYEGSLTIPTDLLELADIVPYEAVEVWNVTRGTRFTTYAIEGSTNSRDIAANGAAAHLAHPGDLVIIASFVQVPESEVRTFKPKLVFVDSDNYPTLRNKEVPGPRLMNS